MSKSFQLQKPKIIKNGKGLKRVVLGDNQVIKLSGNDTNGQCLIIEQYDDPGVGIPHHTHQNEDEIFKVLEGELKIKIGDSATILKAGDLAFCPRGIPHSWEVVGNKKLKSILSIFPAGLEAMFDELSKLPAGEPNFEAVAKIAYKYDIVFC